MFIRFVTALSCFLIVSTARGATASHTNTAGRFAFEINGNALGYVKSIEGGGIYADIIDEGSAPNGATPKHLGAVHCEDVTLRIGLQDGFVPNLVQSLLAGKPQPMDCKLTDSDFDGSIRSETLFKNTILTEFSLPALDGSSKEAGYFALKLTPESGAVSSGNKGQSSAGKVGPKQKAWLTSNFRIDIDGIPTMRVARIEPLTVRMATASGAGAFDAKGSVSKHPGALQLSTIRLAVSAADGVAWQAWFDDFVLKGKNGAANEKNGSITLLAPDMKTPLLVFNLYNIGIARLTEAPREANSEQIRRLDAELYFERIEIAGASGAAAAVQTKPPETPPAGADPVASSPPATSPTTNAAAAPAITRATRTPIAAAETDTYIIKPNLKLAGDTGRVVVRFPEGIRNRDNQRTLFPKNKQEKNSEINWGSVAREMPPGDYLVTLNGKLLEGIRVQAGADTQIRLGVLRLELPDNQSWELIEEDLDSAPALFYAGGPADLALPVGAYYVRTKSQIAPVTIEDGKFTTFGSAAAAPAGGAVKK